MVFSINNKKILRYLLLLSFAIFLLFPKDIFAEDFQNINSEKIDKYLQLSENNAENLIHSLIKVFHDEWEDMMLSGHFNEKEMAVPIIMREVVKIKTLNNLLVDAPIETAWSVINGALKISKIFLIKDISGILKEFEKESVKKAVIYGLNFLIENDVRTSSGAIDFKYISKNNEEKSAIIQYILIYKPIDKKNGEFEIRFYSVKPLVPPKNKGSLGMTSGVYTELTGNLPPFTVFIRGQIENFNIIKKPETIVDFSSEIPNLDIKPANLFERQLVKPIESNIKEVEIIITKVTGKSLGLTDVWEKIKKETESFLSKINIFSPAALVETPQAQNIINKPFDESIEFFVIDSVNHKEYKPDFTENQFKKINLADIQESFDDILEKVDVLYQDDLVIDLVKHNKNIEEKDGKIEPIKETENKSIEEEQEEILAPEEEIVQELSVNDLCNKNGLPARNKVIFNEIAWMGTINSSNDEWIELKNISNKEINLNGWQILNGSDQVNIKFESGIIPENDYFLLERTDDNSVPDFTADLIYKGALKNINETLYIFDENCQMQDMISDLPEWNYGDNSTKQTMERNPDLTWQSSESPGGTPKSKNSQGHKEPSINYNLSPAPTPLPSEDILQSDESEMKISICSRENATSSPSYSPVIFNEIAWMGTASSSADEWIELKNLSTSTVFLNNWQLLGINSENNENKITVIFNENDVIDSYSLLERTDDETIPEISADKIFTGSINDSNFVLSIFDENCSLIDEIEASSTWLKGQKESERRTMERKNDLEWQTSNSTTSFNGLFGTPKTENSQNSELTKENQLPSAEYFWQPESPIINQEIIFDASSSADPDGTITSYFWNFGDEISTTTENSTTTYVYSSSSEYVIGLQTVDNENATSLIATSSIIISVQENPTLEIVINEIAWMGTSATNSGDEWIELYNNTNSDIDLTGWKILKNGGDFIEISTSTILANEFYLLERTDDTTISDISADLIYTGSLKNDGEKLELRDNNNNLVDMIDCSSGWFAGTTTEGYISMERINSMDGDTPTNWLNNNQVKWDGWQGKDTNGIRIYGTPRTENSVSKLITKISGKITDYNILPLIGSPYIITDTLTVLPEKTLTIEAGVSLKFQFQEPYVIKQGPKLEIEGNLMAIGKQGKEIIFEPTEDLWPGIIFYDSEEETEISSMLEHIIIENARNWENEDYSSLSIINKSVSIKNSVIKNYSERAIKLVSSNSIIDNLKFSGKGIIDSFTAIDIQKGSPIIRNCELIEKNKYGVNIGNLRPEDLPIIENNMFIENSFPIYSVSPNMQISGNKGNNINNKISVWGNIYQDTAWLANEFPYVSSYIKVFPDATLTLNSGINWEIEHGGIVEIEGSIIINGTLENLVSIYIPGSYTEHSYFYLNSLTAISSVKNAIFIRNPIIGNGENGITIKIYNGKANFNNVVFNNTSATGLHLEDIQEITIINSLFKENRLGLKIEGVNAPLITQTNFENNLKADIYWPNGGEDCEQIKINLDLKVECACCPY